MKQIVTHMHPDTFLLKIRRFLPTKISSEICRRYIAKNVDKLIFVPREIRESTNQIAKYLEGMFCVPIVDIDWLCHRRSFSELKDSITEVDEHWKEMYKFGYECVIGDETIHIEEWPLYKVLETTESFDAYLGNLKESTNDLKKEIRMLDLYGRHNLYFEFEVEMYSYASFIRDTIIDHLKFICDHYNWDNYYKNLILKVKEENS